MAACQIYEPGKTEATVGYSPILREWDCVPREGDLVKVDGKTLKVGALCFHTDPAVSPAAETAPLQVRVYLVAKLPPVP